MDTVTFCLCCWYGKFFHCQIIIVLCLNLSYMDVFSLSYLWNLLVKGTVHL